jgi:AcrR family transcriptional regulator
MSSVEVARANERSRLTRAQAKAKTRALLLEAAAEIFAEKGYAAASVDEIAAAAGFTIGALYAHFDNKEALFLAALEQHFEHDLEEIQRLCASADRFPDGLDAVTRFVDTEEHRRWWLLSVECWLQAMRNETIRERLAELETRCRDGIAEIVTQAFSDRRVPPRRARELASIAMGLTRGLVMQRLLEPGAVHEHLLRDALVPLFETPEADRPVPANSTRR